MEKRNRKGKWIWCLLGICLAAGVGFIFLYKAEGSRILTSVAEIDNAVINEDVSCDNMAENDSDNIVSNVGSVSKVYVSTAILQLSEQGLIDLDASVTAYLPEFEMEDERYRDITIRMLMNHSSGLMGSTWADSMLYEDVDSSAHDGLLEKLKKQRLKADPGDYSVYCNDGFFLLELVAERVSGMDYTAYIQENIASPLSLTETGTPYDLFRDPRLNTVYLPGGERYGYEYCMDLGSGGILASAPDLCKFGTAFYTGNNTLLSDDAKKEMFTSCAKDSFESPYGLGWDDVTYPQYEDAGITVVGKGGDTGNMHSYLLVAPDEKVSIAVNASGGSSLYVAGMADAMMTEILNTEKGAGIERPETGVQLADVVPDAVKAYAGVYADNHHMPFKVEFTDTYMVMRECDKALPEVTYYKPTKDGGFIKLSGNAEDGTPDYSGETWYFTKRNNKRSYIARTYTHKMDNLSDVETREYYAEHLEEMHTSVDIMQNAKQYEGMYRLSSGKYSDTFIESYLGEFKLLEDAPGYAVLFPDSLCSTVRIAGDGRFEAFLQIPCQNGRDQSDIIFRNENGQLYADLVDSAETLLAEKSMPPLKVGTVTVSTVKDRASWYKLSDAVKGRTLFFEKTDKTSIHVFDKYGTMVYSSYMMDHPYEVPLPSDGAICVRGETGEKVSLAVR